VTERQPVCLHPRAEEDAAAAYRWYLERNPMIAEIFFAELDAAMEHIARNPRRWPRLRDSYRRYLLGRFPFSVVYRERPGHVEVVAIAHHRKRPAYWAQR
jgi:toxin ParE1/3/4